MVLKCLSYLVFVGVGRGFRPVEATCARREVGWGGGGLFELKGEREYERGSVFLRQARAPIFYAQ